MRQFAVVGLGIFGTSVAKTLAQKGHQVLAIDIDQELVNTASEFVANAVQVDATDEKALKAVGIQDVDVAIVSVGTNLEASILITLTLKELGIQEIVAKAISEAQGKVLKKVGATKIVFPERDMGARIANTLVSPNILEHIDLSENHSMMEIVPPSDFIGKTVGQIGVRSKYGVNIIGIKKKDEMNIVPTAKDIINEGDSLIVVGSNEDIEKMKKKH